MDMRKGKIYHGMRAAAVLLLVLILTLTGAGSARADELAEIDPDRDDCSITLTLQYKEGGKSNNLVGGEISLYTVATVKTDEGFSFDITEGKFSDVSGVSDIPSMDSKQLSKNNFSLAKTMEAPAAKVKADQTEKITDGKVSFTNLKPGLYLIVQSKLSEGDRKVNSFLISIPDEEGNFQIEGEPKPGIYTPKEPETETPSGGKSPSGKLPQTGQLWWPVPVMGCTGICFIFLGIWLGRRRADS